MAEEAGEVNTAVEDGGAAQPRDEREVSNAESNGELGGSDGLERKEKSAEYSWSAPLLSLARKATETISGGVSYAVAPTNPSQGSGASSPTERDSENELNSTSRKLPGSIGPLLLMEGISWGVT